MKNFLLVTSNIALIFFLLTSPAYSQECNCDYIIRRTEQVVDARAKNIKAGQTVCIEKGKRGSLLLINFQGTDQKPIQITNKDGKVTFENGAYGIKTIKSNFLHIAGKSISGSYYGIEIKNTNRGIDLEYLSSDIEIDHLSISNTYSTAIIARTELSCDSATWRRNFQMNNIVIHHNNIKITGGEGICIGNDFFQNPKDYGCGPIYSHKVKGVKIFRNIIKNTGTEAIQVSGATENCAVFENYLEDYGISPYAGTENSGLMLGEGTSGSCYNNTIRSFNDSIKSGNAITCIGYGDNLIFNNMIIDPDGNGIYLDERFSPGNGFKVINNTIINPGKNGVQIDAENLRINHVKNNIIIIPGEGDYVMGLNEKVKISSAGNFCSERIEDVMFVDPEKGDFHIQAGSPVIDQGVDVAKYGVTFDFDHKTRPFGLGFDIGAYELHFDATKIQPPFALR